MKPILIYSSALLMVLAGWLHSPSLLAECPTPSSVVAAPVETPVELKPFPFLQIVQFSPTPVQSYGIEVAAVGQSCGGGDELLFPIESQSVNGLITTEILYPKPLAPNQMHTLCVRSVCGEGSSSFVSAPFGYSFNPPPDAPGQIQSIPESPSLETLVQFQWDPVVNAIAYRVQFFKLAKGESPSCTGSAPLVEANLTEPTWTVPDSVLKAAGYFGNFLLCVRSVDAVQQESASPAMKTHLIEESTPYCLSIDPTGGAPFPPSGEIEVLLHPKWQAASCTEIDFDSSPFTLSQSVAEGEGPATFCGLEDGTSYCFRRGTEIGENSTLADLKFPVFAGFDRMDVLDFGSTLLLSFKNPNEGERYVEYNFYLSEIAHPSLCSKKLFDYTQPVTAQRSTFPLEKFEPELQTRIEGLSPDASYCIGVRVVDYAENGVTLLTPIGVTLDSRSGRIKSTHGISGVFDVVASARSIDDWVLRFTVEHPKESEGVEVRLPALDDERCPLLSLALKGEGEFFRVDPADIKGAPLGEGSEIGLNTPQSWTIPMGAYLPVTRYGPGDVVMRLCLRDSEGRTVAGYWNQAELSATSKQYGFNSSLGGCTAGNSGTGGIFLLIPLLAIALWRVRTLKAAPMSAIGIVMLTVGAGCGSDSEDRRVFDEPPVYVYAAIGSGTTVPPQPAPSIGPIGQPCGGLFSPGGSGFDNSFATMAAACECTDGETGSCTMPNGCAGTRSCSGGNWGGCVANNPACQCASGTTGGVCATGALGQCALGTQLCSSGGLWQCVPNALPQPDLCGDNLDQDCDGSADEGCICANGATQSCGTGISGLCGVGSQICLAGTAWSACVPNVQPGQVAELCGDGVDQNCDGTVDETCVCTPGSTQSCDSGLFGICSVGIQHCGVGGAWGGCSASIQPGEVAEVCATSVDEDCDGLIDEGCTGGGSLPPPVITVLAATGTPYSQEKPLLVISSYDVAVATSFEVRVAPYPNLLCEAGPNVLMAAEGDGQTEHHVGTDLPLLTSFEPDRYYDLCVRVRDQSNQWSPWARKTYGFGAALPENPTSMVANPPRGDGLLNAELSWGTGKEAVGYRLRIYQKPKLAEATCEFVPPQVPQRTIELLSTVASVHSNQLHPLPLDPTGDYQFCVQTLGPKGPALGWTEAPYFVRSTGSYCLYIATGWYGVEVSPGESVSVQVHPVEPDLTCDEIATDPDTISMSVNAGEVATLCDLQPESSYLVCVDGQLAGTFTTTQDTVSPFFSGFTTISPEAEGTETLFEWEDTRALTEEKVVQTELYISEVESTALCSEGAVQNPAPVAVVSNLSSVRVSTPADRTLCVRGVQTDFAGNRTVGPTQAFYTDSKVPYFYDPETLERSRVELRRGSDVRKLLIRFGVNHSVEASNLKPCDSEWVTYRVPPMADFSPIYAADLGNVPKQFSKGEASEIVWDSSAYFSAIKEDLDTVEIRLCGVDESGRKFYGRLDRRTSANAIHAGLSGSIGTTHGCVAGGGSSVGAMLLGGLLLLLVLVRRAGWGERAGEIGL